MPTRLKQQLHRRARARRISLKRMIPNSLFSRALLILLLPVILLQLFVAYVFYDRHWDSVVRNMANSAAAEVAMLSDIYYDLNMRIGPEDAVLRTHERANQLGMKATLDMDSSRFKPAVGASDYPDFYDNLSRRIPHKFSIVTLNTDTIRIRIAVEAGVLNLDMSRKRLASSTTFIFILWMVGSALLLTTIAILFLRNQVRPIVQLARVAEQFGLGQEVVNFSPRGAIEIRRAGRAFLMMSERIRRHVASRTEMLAGISHDLRTPLTRMKLEIEMGKIDDVTRDALAADIEEMRVMIDEYLDFARGDAGELAEPLDVVLFLADVVQQYQRQNSDVRLGLMTPVTLMLRPQAMRRAVANLIDNALRYGGGVAILSLEQSLTFVRIKVTDVGPGIPEAEQEHVFKPFTRLEPSRNIKTGGVGLGLSIVRAIAQSHGGEVSLENIRDEQGAITGMEATIRLPRAVQQQGQ
jgi:two-component system osmolarity sensor histidine kinase EnvZ